MVRIIASASLKTSSPSRPRPLWCSGVCLHRRTLTRSHAAAPSGSEAEGVPSTASETTHLVRTDSGVTLIESASDIGPQYEQVHNLYNEEGELDEAKMASKYGMKVDENGDIVFAQRDEQGNLSFAPDVEPYDPMFHGKWVEIDGVEVKMPDYDFSQHDWILRVESDIGWQMFWRYAAHSFVCDTTCCKKFELHSLSQLSPSSSSSQSDRPTEYLVCTAS
jgi:hypothetical protein